MSKTEESPSQDLIEAERDELVRMRSEFMATRNEKRFAVLAHILWVSATIFAVIVIAGHADFGVLISIAIVANAVCILACCASLYRAIATPDRAQQALGAILRNGSLLRTGRSGTQVIRRANHRNWTIFLRRDGGSLAGGVDAFANPANQLRHAVEPTESNNVDVSIFEGRDRFFGACESVAYVSFVLMVICLAAAALLKSV